MCHLVYELRPDLGLDEVGGPHVADPEHQEQPPVPLADHSVPGRGGGGLYPAHFTTQIQRTELGPAPIKSPVSRSAEHQAVIILIYGHNI